jgi:peptidoglycan/LPS O-acetylase OafA/YrhL
MNQSDMPAKPIFQNLDGLRFIAFLCVFISHCFFPSNPIVKDSSLYKGILFFVGDSHWGNVGLYIFFSMSGFLITYLLIHEHKAYGKIFVVSFYLRRILRIWPLYFLLLAVCFFVYPYFSGYQTPIATRWAYTFFYANFNVIENGFDVGGIGHLWAISVEEQFYLLLPLSMLLVPIRYMHYLFGVIIVGSLTFRLVHYQEATVLFHHSLSAAFDISIGGLAAWLMYFNESARNLIARLSKTIIVCMYTIFSGLILFQDYIFSGSQLVLSLFLFQMFAAFVLIEQNYASHSFFKVGQSRWLTFLGKYAYGFFCYHILCIRATSAVFYKFEFNGVVSELILVPLFSLLLTLAVAITSYHLFEIHFLKLKKPFTYLH